MISTHNTTFRTRLYDHLQDRGFDPQPAGRVDRYTAQTAPDNILNHLFAFPVLDMAFLRYETEMIAIDDGLSVLTGHPDGCSLNAEDPLRRAAADSLFWGYIAHALEEGDAAPHRHLHAYLVDGEVESVVKVTRKKDVMQKFVNPEGLIAHFEGGAVSELGRHDPDRHKLTVKVTLSGSNRLDELVGTDAFNALDFFIVSVELADDIDAYTDWQWLRRRAFLVLNGQKLDRSYVVLILDQLAKIGALKATEADWMPDASYPVVPGAMGDMHLALDQELKFPVIFDPLVDALKAKGYSFSSRAYPVEAA